MGQIIGLGVTHYPGLYARDEDMADLLRRTLSGKHLPERARDPSNWPAEMRAEWGTDGGAATARAHRERCFVAFRDVRAKLDAFQPNFVLIFGDDQYENFTEDIVPPFCLYILDEMESRPFKGKDESAKVRTNIWGEGPDKVFHHRGHSEGSRFLANRLAEEDKHVPYAYRLRYQKGLAHAFINTLMFLDAERTGFDYPVIPFHVNCYGGSLIRSHGGNLTPGATSGEPDPPAPSAAACFDLGRIIGRVLAKSPWRVALVASSSWSHAFLTARNDWIYPDHASDRQRLQDLKDDRLEGWRALARDKLEDAGQHELLNWVVLAGAMTELGHKAQIIDFIESYVMNSNKCFAYWG